MLPEARSATRALRGSSSPRDHSIWAATIPVVRAVIQRVSRAEVRAGESTVGRIGPGLLLLVGVEDGDGLSEVDALVGKVVGLRVFADAQGLMNRSVAEVGGSVLVVSQFTLLGDVRRGRRPSFAAAGHPDHARALLDRVVDGFRSHGITTGTGEFGAKMEVDLVNDGPVTLILEVRDGKVL